MTELSDSIQTNFDKTIEKLERMTNTFPEISTLWKNYLTIKKQHLEKQIAACDMMFSMMERDNVDITIPTFIMLYCIYNLQEQT